MTQKSPSHSKPQQPIVDHIIGQLRQMITSGQIKPGQRLPAERVLAEQFAVGRSYVREAILKLEFYGLLKTNPQSGTYVSGLSIKMLDSIIADIVNFNKEDFNALLEARYYLERDAVKLAAERRSVEDLQRLKEALVEYEEKTNAGEEAYQEDMMFHIQIARASKNSVIESMILVLIPDLVKNMVGKKIFGAERKIQAIQEHRDIYHAIREKDPKAAHYAISSHLSDLLEISRHPNGLNAVTMYM
ncbi:MAG: FadR family transcriptional regulator [Pedobacter sp.]|nr:MAG: FadR family transcriptional regulator [Pedobacter sp.]